MSGKVFTGDSTDWLQGDLQVSGVTWSYREVVRGGSHIGTGTKGDSVVSAWNTGERKIGEGSNTVICGHSLCAGECTVGARADRHCDLSAAVVCHQVAVVVAHLNDRLSSQGHRGLARYRLSGDRQLVRAVESNRQRCG